MNRKTMVYLILLCVLFGLTVMTSSARTGSNQTPINFRTLDFGDSGKGLASSNSQEGKFELVEREQAPLPEGFSFDIVDLIENENMPSLGEGETCSQVLLNTQLDVIEIGGGQGFPEPWVVLWSNVYFQTQDYISPDYSLWMDDGDTVNGDPPPPPIPPDPSPEIDSFGQAFIMPDNLTSIELRYWTRQINQDQYPYDNIWALFFAVDDEGFLIDPPIAEHLFPEYFDNEWHPGSASSNDPGLMDALEDQILGLVLLFDTDEIEPYEAAVFDDVELEVCYETPVGGPQKLFLPTMINRFSTGPSCFPPTENPPDEFDANRGLVQTGATCNTTLSNLDLQDYYTYRTNQSGTYRFTLSALPPGSEWSATLFVDAPPYPIADGGTCRTTQTGSGDKFVDCNLPANGNFFIKVAAGNWQGGTAGYTLQVTRR